tara:strand:- start:153 stop:482 length:330 start_codon:yes stop_codon:yes gene_type:complete
MKHLTITLLALIISFSMTAEEYICSTIFSNEIVTTTIKRKDNYFLAQLIGGDEFKKFDVIVENDYTFSIVFKDIPLYLIIYQINKDSLKFTAQEFGYTTAYEGKCVLRD